MEGNSLKSLLSPPMIGGAGGPSAKLLGQFKTCVYTVGEEGGEMQKRQVVRLPSLLGRGAGGEGQLRLPVSCISAIHLRINSQDHSDSPIKAD